MNSGGCRDGIGVKGSNDLVVCADVDAEKAETCG
jgi:hypothetical protein